MEMRNDEDENRIQNLMELKNSIWKETKGKDIGKNAPATLITLLDHRLLEFMLVKVFIV